MQPRDVCFISLGILGAFCCGLAAGVLISRSIVGDASQARTTAPQGRDASLLEPKSGGGPPSAYVLDGYCPVTLVEQRLWKRGSVRWRQTIDGQVYLFAGRQELTTFQKNPASFTPLASGMDIVLQLEQGALVPGKREHGLFVGSRVVLFANEASVQRFTACPDRYLSMAGTEPPAEHCESTEIAID